MYTIYRRTYGILGVFSIVLSSRLIFTFTRFKDADGGTSRCVPNLIASNLVFALNLMFRLSMTVESDRIVCFAFDVGWLVFSCYRTVSMITRFFVRTKSLSAGVECWFINSWHSMTGSIDLVAAMDWLEIQWYNALISFSAGSYVRLCTAFRGDNWSCRKGVAGKRHDVVDFRALVIYMAARRVIFVLTVLSKRIVIKVADHVRANVDFELADRERTIRRAWLIEYDCVGRVLHGVKCWWPYVGCGWICFSL